MPAHPQKDELARIYDECRKHGSPVRLVNRWLDMHSRLYQDGRPGLLREFWLSQLRLLLNDERVQEVVMTNRNLFITTKPIIVRHRDPSRMGMYLGRALIQIPRADGVDILIEKHGIETYRYRVFCIESGRKDGAYGLSYSLTGFGFCFGGKHKHILENIEKGHSVAEAVFTMLDGFWHINSSDWSSKARDFRAVTPSGIIEPALTGGGAK